LSSTLGMLRFNVSKHSFKCARLKKAQVVGQLVGAHTRNQFSRGLELNLGLHPAKHSHMCIAETRLPARLQLSQPGPAERLRGWVPGFQTQLRSETTVPSSVKSLISPCCCFHFHRISDLAGETGESFGSGTGLYSAFTL